MVYRPYLPNHHLHLPFHNILTADTVRHETLHSVTTTPTQVMLILHPVTHMTPHPLTMY